MLPSSKIDQALLLTASRFEGIVDEDGQPYMLHCLRVMLSFTDPTLQIVGLMHDLIEDTPTTLDELTQLGFGAGIVEAIGLLTRTSEISYADYIIRLKPNEIARQVKQADLREIGSQGVVSEILAGNRELNIRQIRALSERFGVSPATFV